MGGQKHPAGEYETHNPLDWSVAELEREDIPFDSCHWEGELESDMRTRSLSYLRSHYPELAFDRWAAKTKPKGHDFAVDISGPPKLWTVADWRTK